MMQIIAAVMDEFGIPATVTADSDDGIIITGLNVVTDDDELCKRIVAYLNSEIEYFVIVDNKTDTVDGGVVRVTGKVSDNINSFMAGLSTLRANTGIVFKEYQIA